MKSNAIETIVGFTVIIIAMVFLGFAYNKGGSNLRGDNNGYLVQAAFQNAEGIVEGSDIRLAGIRIGVVESLHLDKNTFLALISLRIDPDIKLPKDSQAAVATNGLLGNKFISITPGSLEENLVDNDEIKYTQSAINIEALISKLMYSFTNK